MNGCCMTHAESSGHCHDCYWYWPCGCAKERSGPGAPPRMHTHTYGAPTPPVKETFVEKCRTCGRSRDNHNVRHIFVRPNPESCARCGAQKDDHPYKHAFKSWAAVRAMQESE